MNNFIILKINLIEFKLLHLLKAFIVKYTAQIVKMITNKHFLGKTVILQPFHGLPQ